MRRTLVIDACVPVGAVKNQYHQRLTSVLSRSGCMSKRLHTDMPFEPIFMTGCLSSVSWQRYHYSSRTSNSGTSGGQLQAITCGPRSANNKQRNWNHNLWGETFPFSAWVEKQDTGPVGQRTARGEVQASMVQVGRTTDRRTDRNTLGASNSNMLAQRGPGSSVLERHDFVQALRGTGRQHCLFVAVAISMSPAMPNQLLEPFYSIFIPSFVITSGKKIIASLSSVPQFPSWEAFLAFNPLKLHFQYFFCAILTYQN